MAFCLWISQPLVLVTHLSRSVLTPPSWFEKRFATLSLKRGIFVCTLDHANQLFALLCMLWGWYEVLSSLLFRFEICRIEIRFALNTLLVFFVYTFYTFFITFIFYDNWWTLIFAKAMFVINCFRKLFWKRFLLVFKLSKLVSSSISIYSGIHFKVNIFQCVIDTYWTPDFPVGIQSNRPCPSFRPSVFKYLRDRSLVFSETLHEVRGQLSKKSETAEILKKD